MIEKIWGKERILEVYLNVAEMGKDIYGIEAASQRYFGVPASKLTVADASSLAACLPCPLEKTPEIVNRQFPKRRAAIAAQSKEIIILLTK